MTRSEIPSPAVAPAPARRRWFLLATLTLPLIAIATVEARSYRNERQARQAMKDERFDDAQRDVESALRFRSRSASLHILAARIDRQRGVLADAEQHLSRAQQLAGMTDALQLEWLLLRCQRGEVDELAPLLLAAVNRGHPESPAILETLAAAYIREGRYGEAMPVLDRWVQLDPESARAWDSRGWLNSQMDYREPAIADYEKALQLQPGRAAVRLRLAQILLVSLRNAEAAEQLEILRFQQPKNPAVLVKLAQCWAALSRVDDARALLDQVLATHSEDFDALFQRGNLEATAGNPVEAERWLRRALKRDPRAPDARYALYLSLEAQGNRQAEAQKELQCWQEERKARDRLSRLLRTELSLHPNDPNLAAEAGDLFLQMGEDQRGLFWLHRALAMDPRNAAGHQALMGYYERIGDSAQADEHRRQIAAQQR
jgi:tetratricopeptide (TPR) repeat protein